MLESIGTHLRKAARVKEEQVMMQDAAGSVDRFTLTTLLSRIRVRPARGCTSPKSRSWRIHPYFVEMNISEILGGTRIK